MPRHIEKPEHVRFGENLADVYANQRKKEVLEAIENLIQENHAKGGSQFGYTHLTKIYHVDWINADTIQRTNIPEIHPDLRDMAEALRLDLDSVEPYRTKLRQAVATITRHCKSKQDVRDLFPDHMLKKVGGDIMDWAREAPPGFLFKNKPIQQKQFNALLALLAENDINTLVGQ